MLLPPRAPPPSLLPSPSPSLVQYSLSKKRAYIHLISLFQAPLRPLRSHLVRLPPQSLCHRPHLRRVHLRLFQPPIHHHPSQPFAIRPVHQGPSLPVPVLALCTQSLTNPSQSQLLTFSTRTRGQNPGALAALIVGICVVIAGILALAWFTVKRHRMRDEEDQGYDQPQMASAGRSVSAGDVPPGSGRSRIIDDDPDLEIQSSAGHEVRDSSVGHAAIVSSPPGVVNPGGRSEQRADESGYFATHTTAASSNGHSSHVHITANTRNSSPTQANNPTSRNTSPTHSRRKPNRARFSLSPDRSATPSAWPPSRSEAPSRRRSVDDLPDLLHNPHRVYSDPVVFNDAPRLRSIYPRRQSSEVPRLDILPPILIHTPPPNPPSSLLRPPSATQIPTRQTLQQSRIHLDLPFVNDPVPSPAASSVSVLSGREGLLSTPPHHPTESLSSLRDSKDYSRPIGGGVSISCLSRSGLSLILTVGPLRS